MHQANQSGWYVDADGNEVFVAKGTVRPDNHPDVKTLSAVFDQLEDEPKATSRAKKS